MAGSGYGDSAPQREPVSRSGRDSLELTLAALAKGDQAAFRAVYDQAAPAVLRSPRK
jgi:hypothetical protein